MDCLLFRCLVPLAGHATVFLVLEFLLLLQNFKELLEWLWVGFYFFDIVNDEREDFIFRFFLNDLVCEILSKGYE